MARPPEVEYPRRSIPREAAAWDTMKTASGDTVIAGQSAITEYIRLQVIVPPATFAGIPTGDPSPIDGVTLPEGALVAYDNGVSIWSGFWQVHLTTDWTRILHQYHRRGQIFEMWDGTVKHDQLWSVETNNEIFIDGTTNIEIRRHPHDDKGRWENAGPAVIAIPAAGPGLWQWLVFPTSVVTSEWLVVTNTNYYRCDLPGTWTFRLQLKQNIQETAGLAEVAVWPQAMFSIHKIPAGTTLPLLTNAAIAATQYGGFAHIDEPAQEFQHDARVEATVVMDMAMGDYVACSLTGNGFAPFTTYTMQNLVFEAELGGPRR